MNLEYLVRKFNSHLGIDLTTHILNYFFFFAILKNFLKSDFVKINNMHFKISNLISKMLDFKKAKCWSEITYKYALVAIQNCIACYKKWLEFFSEYPLWIAFILLVFAYFMLHKQQEIAGLIQYIGSALIGASAITLSIALFAMENSKKEMPHGLFRELFPDKVLFFYFVLTVSSSIGIVIAASYVSGKHEVPNILFIVLTLIFIIFRSFKKAYHRVAVLINPKWQLDRLESEIPKILLFLEHVPSNHLTDDTFSEISSFTKDLIGFNPDKRVESLIEKIDQVFSYIERHAKEEDHEITEQAFKVLVNVHQKYLASLKQNDLPVSPDSVPTFAGLKQRNAQSALLVDTSSKLGKFFDLALAQHKGNYPSRRYVSQMLEMVIDLIEVYLKTANNSKDEATTLGRALILMTQKMNKQPIISGLSQYYLGEAAQLFLEHAHFSFFQNYVEEIERNVCKKNDEKGEVWPDITIACEVLAKLTISLLNPVDCGDNSGAVNEAISTVNKAINNIAQSRLQLPNTARFPDQRYSCLASYYFHDVEQSILLKGLRHLVEKICEANDTSTSLSMERISFWINDLLQPPQLQFLKETIQSRKDSLLILWIAEVINLLLKLANIKSCPQENKLSLNKNVDSLLQILESAEDVIDGVLSIIRRCLKIAVDIKRYGSGGFAERLTKFACSLALCLAKRPLKISWPTVEIWIFPFIAEQYTQPAHIVLDTCLWYLTILASDNGKEAEEELIKAIPYIKNFFKKSDCKQAAKMLPKIDEEILRLFSAWNQQMKLNVDDPNKMTPLLNRIAHELVA